MNLYSTSVRTAALESPGLSDANLESHIGNRNTRFTRNIWQLPRTLPTFIVTTRQTILQTSMDERVTTLAEMDLTNDKSVEAGFAQRGKQVGSSYTTDLVCAHGSLKRLTSSSTLPTLR